MIQPNPNLFTGNPLNRVGVERRDPAFIGTQRHHPDAQFLPFDRGQPLTHQSNQKVSLGWLNSAAMNSLPTRTEFILLGLRDSTPYWTADVTSDDSTAPAIFADLGTHMALREAVLTMQHDECAIAGHAAWLLDWHRRHRFCPRNGGETIVSEAGFKRIHVQTETEHFPRTDPVAIVQPVHDNYACLGRSPHFPEGMMSAMAGYLEACETLEECAARELYEEVGLRVSSMEYLFSQPWPFPSSLMVGFIAEVDGMKLTLDPSEIAEARWFSRAEIRKLLDGTGPADVFIPPPFAIAHQLLKAWVTR